MVRWLLGNLGTVFLALILAIVVWVVAVTEENPLEVRRLSEPVSIELVGKQDTLVIVGQFTSQAVVTLRAPRSLFATLERDQIQLTADLTGLGPGVHDLPVSSRIGIRTAQIVSVSPDSLRIKLEPLATREIRVQINVEGTPAVGYEAGRLVVDPPRSAVSGPESFVARVSEVTATVNAEALKNDINEIVTLQAVDAEGQPVGSIELQPATARVVVPIKQLGGYKDMAVKVIAEGQVTPGYRVTNISVSPAIVTVFSSDPRSVDLLPGVVETETLDLTGKTDDIERCVRLKLPVGMSVVSVDCVSVLVGVAAIESSLTVPREVELTGLGTGLQATANPPSVDVILTGPLPILDSLAQSDVRVVLDLVGLGVGIYQLTPNVSFLPDGLTVAPILPTSIEVVITAAPETATPTPTPTKRPS